MNVTQRTVYEHEGCYYSNIIDLKLALEKDIIKNERDKILGKYAYTCELTPKELVKLVKICSPKFKELSKVLENLSPLDRTVNLWYNNSKAQGKTKV